MLRSFDYARWSALKAHAHDADEIARFEPALREWQELTRSAFLEAYARTAAGAVPGATLDAGLLALFELDKAMYELRYELNNRVDWVQVPLQGILGLADASSAR